MLTYADEADVITLAHFWLTAAEPARAAAHTLLTARLSRTDAATRQVTSAYRCSLRTASYATQCALVSIPLLTS